MLVELRVRHLGIIEDLTLLFGPGMTAITGETGAGKTLVIEAIELLVGGRADPVLVAPGASEAWVEGRFVESGGREVVLARAVPAAGRSRAYVDGHLAPVSALAEAGALLVDLHGQHAHQSLLSTTVQRAALDAFGQIDLTPLSAARARLHEIDTALAGLGGDARSRAREADLLRYQLAEIHRAELADPEEDDRLGEEEDRLNEAAAHREAAAQAHRALAADGGGIDAVGSVLAALSNRRPLAEIEARVRALAAELSDVASELRAAAEELEEDPERLAEVRERRQALRDLRRKYGDTLRDVVAFAAEAESRLAELESHETRVAALDAERTEAQGEVASAAAVVATARRRSAPAFGAAVEEHLRALGMPRARLEVHVGGDGAADDVSFLFAADPGAPTLPLAKIASGGELARVMLAVRLVLTGGPETLVFDEVDAGIGGEAALAVGHALAALSPGHQVLVVTHLAQVAAFADDQVAVTKHLADGRASARMTQLDHAARVVELSRMLSGQPSSSSARDHAKELLTAASKDREQVGVGAAPGKQATAPAGEGAPARRAFGPRKDGASSATEAGVEGGVSREDAPSFRRSEGGGVGAAPGKQATAPAGEGAPARRGGGVGAPPGKQA